MTGNGASFNLRPGGTLQGRTGVPGDKSISHRAVMLGALAEGTTRVRGFLDGMDCLATRNAFRAMGVSITDTGPGALDIQGVGLHGLQAAPGPLDLGNSGTSMRLLAGLLAGQAFDSDLTGDSSLQRRPMKRVVEPLSTMGAHIRTTVGGTAPLHIRGGAHLRGVRYAMPVASAQIKSCLLLAGLYAEGETTVVEPGPSRDHTERMLSAMGYEVRIRAREVTLSGGGTLRGGDLEVPGDLSSAAFVMVGASIASGSDVMIENVGVNPTRTGVIDILRLMGADITLHNARHAGGEPVADVRVRSAALKGIDIPAALVPLAIDEFPAILVAAACAEGETWLHDAAELRVKESDRIAVMADGLTRLGIDAVPAPDGMRVQGGRLSGGTVDSHGDHRIAMAFAMAALAAEGDVNIRDCDNVNTSFPDFAARMAGLGLNISEERTGHE